MSMAGLFNPEETVTLTLSQLQNLMRKDIERDLIIRGLDRGVSREDLSKIFNKSYGVEEKEKVNES